MTRYIKRGGQVWIKIFPRQTGDAKTAETRMGSGFGFASTWFRCHPGRVLFEIGAVPEDLAREAMRWPCTSCLANAILFLRDRNYRGC
jgi:large subunit ribosomal protein L16